MISQSVFDVEYFSGEEIPRKGASCSHGIHEFEIYTPQGVVVSRQLHTQPTRLTYTSASLAETELGTRFDMIYVSFPTNNSGSVECLVVL